MEWLVFLVWIYYLLKGAFVVGIVYLAYWFGRNRVNITVSKRD